jgi:sulfoxide reductase heme-binding subunit YedZ
LHKLVYLTGIGGVLHYYMLVKSDTRLPLAFAFALALLLGYRIYAANQTPKVPARSPVPPRQ